MEYKFLKYHLQLHLQQPPLQMRLLEQILLFQLLLPEVASISLADSEKKKYTFLIFAYYF